MGNNTMLMIGGLLVILFIASCQPVAEPIQTSSNNNISPAIVPPSFPQLNGTDHSLTNSSFEYLDVLHASDDYHDRAFLSYFNSNYLNATSHGTASFLCTDSATQAQEWFSLATMGADLRLINHETSETEKYFEAVDTYEDTTSPEYLHTRYYHLRIIKCSYISSLDYQAIIGHQQIFRNLTADVPAERFNVTTGVLDFRPLTTTSVKEAAEFMRASLLEQLFYTPFHRDYVQETIQEDNNIITINFVEYTQLNPGMYTNNGYVGRMSYVLSAFAVDKETGAFVVQRQILSIV
ncbi:MAG: hypothetical protein V1725_05920 [archaeon]